MSVRQYAEEVSVASVSAAQTHTPSVPAARGPSARYVWYVVFLLALVNACNYMDRMALSVLAPVIKADLHLSDGQLGLLIGFAFALFYAICGIPIAMWADRGVRRNIIALSLTVWSVMTALSGAVQNFGQFFLARVGVGVGEAGSIPAGQSLICDYVPLKRRSGVFAVLAIGLYVGMMVGMAFAGWLGETIGWRWTFVVLGLPGIALALIVRLTLREPKRGACEAGIAEPGSPVTFWQTLGVLWRCRTYRLLVFFLITNGILLHGLMQWWPSFYVRVFGLSLSFVGVHLGLAIGVGSGLGLVAGGLMANKATERDVRLPLKICAMATLLGLPTAFGSVLVSSPEGSISLVFLTVVLWGIPGGPVLAILYSLARPAMRSTAGALGTFFQSAIGLSLGPFVVGVFSDILAPSVGKDSLRYALLVPMALMPVIVWSLLASAKNLPHDLKAQ